VFLNTNDVILSSMVYRSQNVLAIESKTEIGYRVLFNRMNLMALKYLEWSIFETTTSKLAVVRSIVL